MTTLDRLTVGQSGIIEDVGGDPAVVQRLGEFGLFDGERVEMVGSAPFGDPIEIKIGHSRISLRKAEAVGVRVRPD
ncbi:MAG: ferrous iron transport protein A [Gemmataceae bacterium]